MMMEVTFTNGETVILNMGVVRSIAYAGPATPEPDSPKQVRVDFTDSNPAYYFRGELPVLSWREIYEPH